MTAATTPDEDLNDLRLKAAMYEHLLERNTALEGEVDTLKGVIAGTQNTLDMLTNDLKKRGDQIAQAMLNLAEIAGSAKQQTTALNQQTTAMQTLTSQLRSRDQQMLDVLKVLVPKEDKS